MPRIRGAEHPPYVKTHIYEREFIFSGGVQASRILAAFVTFYADVGSTEVRERTPTCTKAGFNFHRTTALRARKVKMLRRIT